jgi:hypothetical protein
MAKNILITEQQLGDVIKSIINLALHGLSDISSDKDVPNKTTSDDNFYKKVLDCVGAKATKGNMDFMYAWRQAEGGKAEFNPFNTTKRMPNTTDYNSVGVKNYNSMEDGIKATCDTLKLSYYTDIVDGLKNDVGLRKLSKMQGLNKWGTGPLISKVVDGYLAGNTPKPPAIHVG